MIVLSPEFPFLTLITDSLSDVDVTVIWKFEGQNGEEKTRPQRISSSTTTTIFTLPSQSRRAEIVDVYVYSYGSNLVTFAISDGVTNFRIKQVPLTANQSFFLSEETTIISGGGGGGSTAWADITGKPSTFPPSTHTHIISDVTGLQTALDSKPSVGSFTQSTPALLWTVNHNLGRDVLVTVQTLGGAQILSSVTHTSQNQFTVSFNTPQAGKAFYI